MQAVETVYVTPPSKYVDPEWDSPGAYHRTEACASSRQGEDAVVLELSVDEAAQKGYTACGRCLG